MATPRLDIDLDKIRHNTRILATQLGSRGISLTGVTKVASGNVEVARSILAAGAQTLGDSRIDNIETMRLAGITDTIILIRTPIPSQIDRVVAHADISLNSELEVVRQLSSAARRQGKAHGVVLMVDLGDLREGVAPKDLVQLACQTNKLPNLVLEGIGTNLACFGGIKPDQYNMKALSRLASSIEDEIGRKLKMVSGGNSANFDWLAQCEIPGKINHLRLGESIFLGRETLNRNPIDNLYLDSITLVAEVIESKMKPSIPSGVVCQDAFGTKPEFHDRGLIAHALLGIGRQDVLVTGLTPEDNRLRLIGSSSDHIIMESLRGLLAIGEEVKFKMDYGALLAAMSSSSVEKNISPKETVG